MAPAPSTADLKSPTTSDEFFPRTSQSVFGKITPINRNRGRVIDLDHGMKALVTVHPSYLLRLPDADSKAREYGRFVDDLKIAAALLRKSAHAA